MKKNKFAPKQYRFQFITMIFFIVFLLPSSVKAAGDLDNDGISDNKDNCIEVSNVNQRDTDGDNYGNRCDGDLNNDNKTNTLDLNLYKLAHRSKVGDTHFNPHADFNGDNKVNTLDLNIYKTLHRKPPGPSGVLSGINGVSASRFLTQATFGSTTKDINHLLGLTNYEAWIDEQFNTSKRLLLPRAKSIYKAYYEYCLSHPEEGECPLSLSEILTPGEDGVFDTWHDYYRHVWWKNVIDSPDQLRQRISFATRVKS